MPDRRQGLRFSGSATLIEGLSSRCDHPSHGDPNRALQIKSDCLPTRNLIDCLSVTSRTGGALQRVSSTWDTISARAACSTCCEPTRPPWLATCSAPELPVLILVRSATWPSASRLRRCAIALRPTTLARGRSVTRRSRCGCGQLRLPDHRRALRAAGRGQDGAARAEQPGFQSDGGSIGLVLTGGADSVPTGGSLSVDLTVRSF